MSYRELRKIYYDGEAVYKREYEKRFNSDYAKRLDFEIAGRQAFFVESRQVIELSKRILRRDKEIALLCEALPEIAAVQYAVKCLIDEIVVTNNIEGVHSSRKEIGEVLQLLEEQSVQNNRKNRFQSMVIKFYKLFSGENVALDTSRDIRGIYDELVLDEVVSENRGNAPDGEIFRKGQTTVRSVTDKIVHTGVTPESKIIELMDNALAFLKDESVDVLCRMSVFHYLFEYIHPFYDGNGRTGRFILSCCISKNLTPLLAFRISEVIKQKQREYYQAFMTCNDPHNLGEVTPFLTMMLEMIDTAAQELCDSLKQKLERLNRYERFVSEQSFAENEQTERLYSLLIQAALFSENGISTKELQSNLGITANATLKKRLEAVREKGLLITNRVGNKKYYLINSEALDSMMFDMQQ